MTQQLLERFNLTTNSYFIEDIEIPKKTKSSTKRKPVLSKDSVIRVLGSKSLQNADPLEIEPQKAKNMLLAPCLVNPNSFLECTFNGKEENIHIFM